MYRINQKMMKSKETQGNENDKKKWRKRKEENEQKWVKRRTKGKEQRSRDMVD